VPDGRIVSSLVGHLHTVLNGEPFGAGGLSVGSSGVGDFETRSTELAGGRGGGAVSIGDDVGGTLVGIAEESSLASVHGIITSLSLVLETFGTNTSFGALSRAGAESSVISEFADISFNNGSLVVEGGSSGGAVKADDVSSDVGWLGSGSDDERESILGSTELSGIYQVRKGIYCSSTEPCMRRPNRW